MRFRYFLYFFLTSLIFTNPLRGALDWFAYVGTQDFNTGDSFVNPVDVNTHALGTPIALAGGVESIVSIAITPDRLKAFSTGISSNDYFDINLIDGVAALLSPSGHTFFGFTISPDGTTGYLVDSTIPGQIVIIDVASGGIKGTISMPGSDHPFNIAVTLDGTKGYVTNRNSDDVSVLDLVNNTASATTIPVGTLPQGIAITPDGSEVWVGNRQTFSISVISTATDTVIATIPLGVSSNPTVYDIAILPDGSKAYVSVDDPTNPQTAPGQVFIIDIATRVVTPGPMVEVFPQGIAVSPDGLQVFVVNNNRNIFSTVSVIDTTTDQISETITLTNFGNGRGIAITPDQAPIAQFTVDVQPAGSPTTFDASSSSPSPLSPASVTIVSYAWDFGDGTLVSTTNPIIEHTYAVAGDYTVVLTVTNSVGTSTTQVSTGRTLLRNGGASAVHAEVIRIPSPCAPCPPCPPCPPTPPSNVILPPRDLRASRVKNEFLVQTEFLNVLRWDPPLEGQVPVEYRIYRNKALTQLAGVVPGNTFVFADHNRRPRRTYTYYVVSVDQAGNRSKAIKIVVRGSRR